MKDRIFSIAHYADAGVLYLLIALSLLSLLIIGERYWRLSRWSKLSREERLKLEGLLNAGQVRDLDQLNLNPESIEGRAIARAFAHISSNGSKGLEETFSTFLQFEQPKLDRSLTFLATVGSNAPYIGLFGTVLGIMKSFHDLAHASSAGQQTVMAGISAALIATAAGLLVAIPNILAFNFFQKQVRAILVGLDSFKDAAVAYCKVRGL